MKPYYQDGAVTIYHGDCREVLGAAGSRQMPPSVGPVDVVIADPPYGDTSLEWDVPVRGWVPLLRSSCLWCFGSLRMFMAHALVFDGWALAQDIVWRKHNGSGFHADRFRRIHEHVVQFYRGEWAALYKAPVYTMDALARTVVRAKTRPTHTGHIERTPYVSTDGGPRLQRSVIDCRSEHGRAVHPTQKPLGIIRPLVDYSCPPGGIVLDPFMGSGSTLVAAREAGRRAIGIEIEERYCEIAARRCAQETLFGAPMGSGATPHASSAAQTLDETEVDAGQGDQEASR